MRSQSHYGYYIFLGLGDFARPRAPLSADWTSTWPLEEWLRRLDRLAGLGANTLFIYLMGHRLPYPSAQRPDCVEAGHPNVGEEFFQQVLDAARARGMELVATFTTTGHAGGYAALHSELAICDAQGKPCEKSPSILCHHQPAAQEYALSVIRECLTRYSGFSGVILHPPEFSYPCYCESCRSRYRAMHGLALEAAPAEEAQRFFMQSNLEFQRGVLEPEIRRLLPGTQLLTFTIPWIFEAQFEKIAPEIPKDTIIVDWDYRLTPERIRQLPDRLRRYGQFGHKVWFMPTSGYAFTAGQPVEAEAARVLEQIELCVGAGCRDIVYFMGPRWWPGVEPSSYFLARRKRLAETGKLGD